MLLDRFCVLDLFTGADRGRKEEDVLGFFSVARDRVALGAFLRAVFDEGMSDSISTSSSKGGDERES